MTVAAQEACALRRVLEQRETSADPLGGLAQAFFQEIQPLLTETLTFLRTAAVMDW
jgi:hypothetical protein